MTPAQWSPSLGALVHGTRTSFRVWAPAASSVDVLIDGRDGAHPLTREADGMFSGSLEDAAPGCRYRYRLNGGDAYPDPASRFQPDGVHGPSMIVSPALSTA